MVSNKLFTRNNLRCISPKSYFKSLTISTYELIWLDFVCWSITLSIYNIKYGSGLWLDNDNIPGWEGTYIYCTYVYWSTEQPVKQARTELSFWKANKHVLKSTGSNGVSPHISIVYRSLLPLNALCGTVLLFYISNIRNRSNSITFDMSDTRRLFQTYILVSC